MIILAHRLKADKVIMHQMKASLFYSNRRDKRSNENASAQGRVQSWRTQTERCSDRRRERERHTRTSYVMVGMSVSEYVCVLSRGPSAEPSPDVPFFFAPAPTPLALASSMRTFIEDSRSSPGGVFEVPAPGPVAAPEAEAAVEEEDSRAPAPEDEDEEAPAPLPVNGSETEARSARMRAELTDANGCSSICVNEGRVGGGVVGGPVGAGAGTGPG